MKKVSFLIYLFSLLFLDASLADAETSFSERKKILFDYGIEESELKNIQKLTLIIEKLLPDRGSVDAIETLFRYIFENDENVFQSLEPIFRHLKEIESDENLKLSEAKKLIKSGAKYHLLEFWLDQLAIDGNAEAHYFIHKHVAGFRSDRGCQEILFSLPKQA